MKNNIGEARRSYAMTRPDGKFPQEAAAAFFGVSVSTYQKWEQGSGKLNGEILNALADKYGCSVEYLLCRTNEPTFQERRSPLPAPDPPLTPDERHLLTLYRLCDAQGREHVTRTAQMCAALTEKGGAGAEADVERAGFAVREAS